jgi:hypothetical protein
VTPQFGASFANDSSVVIYDHNMFIVQGTEMTYVKKFGGESSESCRDEDGGHGGEEVGHEELVLWTTLENFLGR